ncbi:MAG: hypothetical protein KAS97_03090 [Candidatus Aminicenantes bacterium]|nr:hypothetical protein [Candidatus Aminicenantes bacterium]
MQRLFRVSSLINNVTYEMKIYDKVAFHWFVADREDNGLIYEDKIINYSKLSEKNRKNAERYIRELFSEKDATLLKSELDRKSSIITTIEEVKLPIPDHIQPYGLLRVEKGKGFSDLSSHKSYEFPFKVKGFFNINDSYESLKGDENPTEITRLPENFLKGSK